MTEKEKHEGSAEPSVGRLLRVDQRGRPGGGERT